MSAIKASSQAPASPRRVIIIGGGISGLAATHALERARQSGARIEFQLIEAGARLGGVIRTEPADGFILEAGPDSFLTAKPESAELARELGLGDALLGSNDRDRRTYVLHRGRLAALPEGMMMLVPMRFAPMLRTPLLPWSSRIKAAAELFMAPPDRSREKFPDESVESFVTRHFGRALLENIAEPLLAGVYGGDSRALSARSVLTRFWEMESRHGSLIRAVASSRRKRARTAPATGAPPSLFSTFGGGMEQLIQAIEKTLSPASVRLGERVNGLAPAPTDGAPEWRVESDRAAGEKADAVILALPAHESARLLKTLDPELAESLGAIPYSSALIVSLAFDDDVRRSLPPGFGFLVPQKENRKLLACTFVHRKFSGRAPEGKALLRCFLGGSRHPELLQTSDAEIVSLVRGELRAILGISAEPLLTRVSRWPSAMAQYTVGHQARVGAIEAALERHPGLFLAGNAFSGIGISDCIRAGRLAASRALAMFS